MKKSIVLVLTLLFFVVSFTVSVNADVMSWTDRQSLERNEVSTPEGDEGGWVDTQSIIPNDNNTIIERPSESITATISTVIEGSISLILDTLVPSWSGLTYKNHQGAH